MAGWWYTQGEREAHYPVYTGGPLPGVYREVPTRHDHGCTIPGMTMGVPYPACYTGWHIPSMLHRVAYTQHDRQVLHTQHYRQVLPTQQRNGNNTPEESDDAQGHEV